MESRYCFHSVTTILALLLSCNTSFGQLPWNEINLTGEMAKIISVPAHYRYSIIFHSKVPLGSTQSRFVSSEELKKIINTPPLFLDLLERLEGKFYMGNSPGSTVEDVELKGSTPKLIFGFDAGKSVGKHLEIQGGVSFISHSWEGAFPVTVIPFQQTNLKIVKGTIEASTRYTLLNLEAAWFVRRKNFQPFITSGMNVSIPGKSTLKAILANTKLPVTEFEKTSALTFCGGLGMRVIIRKYVFAEAGGYINKLPSQKYGTMLQFSVGCGI